jgi:DNA anti-recombination protein RmuC
MYRLITLRVQRWVQPELDRTVRLLKRANVMLDEALVQNTALKNRNEELSVQGHRLQADNRELHQQLELLKQANEMQARTIERMEKYQQELHTKVENLIARVIRLEVEAGRTPNLPI